MVMPLVFAWPKVKVEVVTNAMLCDMSLSGLRVRTNSIIVAHWFKDPRFGKICTNAESNSCKALPNLDVSICRTGGKIIICIDSPCIVCLPTVWTDVNIY